MRKEMIIELATYIVVPLVMWVVSPLLGKYIDSFFFHYPNTVADSISIFCWVLFSYCVGQPWYSGQSFYSKPKVKAHPTPNCRPRCLSSVDPIEFREIQWLWEGC